MHGVASTYANAGVNIEAGNALVKALGPIVAETQRDGVSGTIGGFGGVFDPKATGYKDPLLVAANDGVGTKLKIAIKKSRHETIGIDLVAMCANDLIVHGAEPLFFLDYFACGKLDNKIAKEVISGIAKGCKIAGCALLGGETAEMPGVYKQSEYDIAGFAVGAVEREKLLPKNNLQEGDVLLGLQSSGIHSNGYSMVRHILKQKRIAMDSSVHFHNDYTVGDCLLEPTRIYVKSIREALKITDGIKALAHITGGGIFDNLSRVIPNNLAANINLAGWSPQHIFGWLKEKGNITDDEMLKTFNCGIGMITIVEKSKVGQVEKKLEEQNEKVFRIGHLTQRNKYQKRVKFEEQIEWT